MAFKNACYMSLAVLLCALASSVFGESSGYSEKQQRAIDLAGAFAIEGKKDSRNILEKLDLSFTQKSEIQNILLAAMQSMDAVNAQLNDLESDPERMLSIDVQEMVKALHQQRVQLAELLSVEILSVLSPEQRTRLKLAPDSDVEQVRESDSGQDIREYEI